MFGMTCRHCKRCETCPEADRQLICTSFKRNWPAILEDPDEKVRKIGKAEYKRIRKRARREAPGLEP